MRNCTQQRAAVTAVSAARTDFFSAATSSASALSSHRPRASKYFLNRTTGLLVWLVMRQDRPTNTHLMQQQLHCSARLQATAMPAAWGYSQRDKGSGNRLYPYLSPRFYLRSVTVPGGVIRGGVMPCIPVCISITTHPYMPRERGGCSYPLGRSCTPPTQERSVSQRQRERQSWPVRHTHAYPTHTHIHQPPKNMPSYNSKYILSICITHTANS